MMIIALPENILSVTKLLIVRLIVIAVIVFLTLQIYEVLKGVLYAAWLLFHGMNTKSQ